ncbi:unnamed protein product, partial [Symbiodinium microadriaticum]
MNSRMGNCGGAQRENLNSAYGARKVYGKRGSNADRVCFDGNGGTGHCHGGNGGNYFDDNCGSTALVAGFREYHRRRSVRFRCRETRPIVKAFECTDTACRAKCANSRCEIKPFCVKALAHHL